MLRISVLIASYRRPDNLVDCLKSLASQTQPPDQIIVVWQGNDRATYEAAFSLQEVLGKQLVICHNAVTGIVPAENAGLSHATGDVILLIDDDAVAPPCWVEKHASFYSDPRVGAVGSVILNHTPDGVPQPTRSVTPIGRLTWFGRVLGNQHDHVLHWRSRPPIEVDHLAGANMSIRRAAFTTFDSHLKPYWHMFEAEACCQVKAKHFQVMFDFSNPVHHSPHNNWLYAQDRSGDLTLKVLNPAYNHAYILAKYSRLPWRIVRFLYLLMVGSSTHPGFIGSIFAIKRSHSLGTEVRLLWQTIQCRLDGWWAGARCRADEYK
jgi:GT2 family glycosyltransferase